MNDIVRKVRCVQRRMAVNRFLEAWTTSLIFVASLLVVFVLVDKVIYVGVDPLFAFAGALGLSVLAAGLVSWIRRPRFLSAAIRADAQMGLKERVSSVLAIEKFETEMERALYDDTLARVQRLSLAEAAPIELPRRARFVPVPVVAAILALFLPTWDLLDRKVAADKEAATIAEVKKVAEELKKKVNELKEKTKGQEMKEVQKILSEMEQLTAEMKKGIPKKDDAMAKLSSLADQAKQRQEQLAGKKSMASELKSAASKMEGKNQNEMGKKLQQGKFGEVAKELEQKMKDLRDGKLNEEQKRQLAKEMQDLANAMKDMPGLQSMQKAAENAGQQLQSMDPKSMEQALQSMQQMQQELSDLDQSLNESQALQQAMDDLQQMQDQLSQSEQQSCPDCGQKQQEGG